VSCDLEVVIVLALQSSIHLEQLSEHAASAVIGKVLSRRLNTKAFARFNSGLGAGLGLFGSNRNKQILPGRPLTFTS
jgi:hypothetical protein